MTAFSEHEIKLSSGTLRYRKGGSGRPILTLHGTGGPNVTQVMEVLALRHTIYQPTGPGWDGTSLHPSVKSVPDLAELNAEFIRTAIGGPCDVIGVSFGGWVALWLTLRHPDLVDQLVLEAPAGLRDPGTGGLPADPAQLRGALFATPERAPKLVRSPEVWAQNRHVRDSYAAGISLDQALLDALPQIKARTLALFGTKDEVCPVEKTGRRLKAGIPHSHLSFIYGAAHALELDQPARTARLIGAFLERGEAFLVRNPEAA
jgi:pimeloyl-ACP methyl ester carboxylesterase